MHIHKRDKHVLMEMSPHLLKLSPVLSFLLLSYLLFRVWGEKKKPTNKPNEKNPRPPYIQGYLDWCNIFLHLMAINTSFSHLCANMNLVEIIGFSSKFSISFLWNSLISFIFISFIIFGDVCICYVWSFSVFRVLLLFNILWVWVKSETEKTTCDGWIVIADKIF